MSFPRGLHPKKEKRYSHTHTHTCDSMTGGVEAGGSGVRGQPELHKVLS